MTTIEQFTDKTIKNFNKDITDKIFISIQNNKGLMEEYLRLIEKHGLDTLNQNIGKRIKEKYNLENYDRNDNPKSILIKSFQEH